MTSHLRTAFVFCAILTIASFASPTQAAVPGQVLHLNFNETSGTTAADSSGNSNAATLINGSSWDANGHIGGALTFTGSTYASTNRLDLGNFTLSTWVRTTSDTARGDLILNFDGPSGSPLFSGYGLVLNPGFNAAQGACMNGGVIGFWVGDLTDNYICTASNIADGQWHLVTATWDNTAKVGTIYIDGAQAATGVRSAASISSSISNMYFGYNPYGSLYYSGSLDDVRVYSNALSSGDIQDIYTQSRPTIVLTGANPLNLTVGDAFVDPGVVSTDFQGYAIAVSSSTLPGPVNTSAVGTFTITYSATDGSGLSTSTERVVNIAAAPVIPNTAPTITLNGSATVTLTVGDIFTDPGVTVSDNEDTTNALVISSTTNPIGGVNTAVAGTYIITYVVTDTANASSSVDRTVTVNTAPVVIPPVVPVTPATPVSTPPTAENNISTSGSFVGTAAFAALTRSSGGNIGGGGQVLGASASCGIYIAKELKPLQNNDTEEVIKLQALINETVGANLPLTGIFGPRTLGALKEFQLKYRSTIMDPWIAKGFIKNGQPTGALGSTTLWTINNMVCPSLQLPKPVI